MMIVRRIAMVALWTLAGVGILCGALWGATALGVVKPLIVISGSMEPEIMTGDLLIATKTDAADLAVGDVATLPSELTEHLVTHRVVAIEPAEQGYLVTMKGDANEFEDALDYRISGQVWQPTVQIPGAGAVVARAATPAVAVPLLVGMVALLGLTWLTPAPVAGRRDARRPASTPAEAVS